MDMDLNALAAKAAEVATIATALEAGLAEESAAEAVVLVRVVESVRPALKALASRIRASKRLFWVNVCTGERFTPSPYRGLCVVANGPEKLYPQGNRGAYGGERLYLLADGSFLRAKYSGTWSNWQGEGSRWRAAFEPLTPQQVCSEYELESIVGEISKALDARLADTSKERTAKATERAEKMRAIAKLVQR